MPPFFRGVYFFPTWTDKYDCLVESCDATCTVSSWLFNCEYQCGAVTDLCTQTGGDAGGGGEATTAGPSVVTPTTNSAPLNPTSTTTTTTTTTITTTTTLPCKNQGEACTDTAECCTTTPLTCQATGGSMTCEP